jgi:hypothetical protein
MALGLGGSDGLAPGGGVVVGGPPTGTEGTPFTEGRGLVVVVGRGRVVVVVGRGRVVVVVRGGWVVVVVLVVVVMVAPTVVAEPLALARMPTVPLTGALRADAGVVNVIRRTALRPAALTTTAPRRGVRDINFDLQPSRADGRPPPPPKRLSVWSWG